MRREIQKWWSPRLNKQMEIVAYGTYGFALLMFPTAAADYLEYERFLLVDAIKPFIESGLLRAYSINSVNRYSLLNEQDLDWVDIWADLDKQFKSNKLLYDYFKEYVPPYKNLALLVTSLYNKAGITLQTDYVLK